MYKLVLTSMVVLFSGCASYYEVPNNVPTALIELDSNVSPVIVQLFKDKQCKISPNGNRLSYISPRYGDQLTGTVKEIEADKPLFITFKMMHLNPYTSGWECAFTGSFNPQTGATYKAIFLFEDNRCYLKIMKKSMNAETKKYEVDPSYKKSKNICFNNITG